MISKNESVTTKDDLEYSCSGNVLLLYRFVSGQRFPTRDVDPCSEEGHQLALIRRSVASREPDGAHLVDMIRALLNSP
jgi:hypothetical protein